MNIEEKNQRLEELYKEIEEINNSIKEERLVKQKEYIGKYFKIDDDDEYTIGKVLACSNYGLNVLELFYNYEKSEYLYSTGTRNPKELKIITEEEFLKDKQEFIDNFNRQFI